MARSQSIKVAEKARTANLQRIYQTAIIIAPIHLAIVVLFINKKVTDNPVVDLWRLRIIYANLFIFIIEIAVLLIVNKLRKRKMTSNLILIFQYGIIAFVLTAGIVVTLIDQPVTGAITPLTISAIIVGTFYFIRPRVASLIFLAVYLIYAIGLTRVSGPTEMLLSNQTNGLLSMVVGLSLSVMTWRQFVASTLQKEQIKAQQVQLEQMAYQDALTGLPNRRFLDEVVKRELARIKRGEHESSIAILDVDNFKEINDTYGHPTGDSVLQQLANLLRSSIRESDIIARLGGEEFIILLTNTPEDGGYIIADKLRQKVMGHDFFVNNNLIKLTISIGISPLITTEKQPNFYAQADKALYEAKVAGKNQVRTENAI